jgi:hypothetical protein
MVDYFMTFEYIFFAVISSITIENPKYCAFITKSRSIWYSKACKFKEIFIHFEENNIIAFLAFSKKDLIIF